MLQDAVIAAALEGTGAACQNQQSARMLVDSAPDLLNAICNRAMATRGLCPLFALTFLASSAGYTVSGKPCQQYLSLPWNVHQDHPQSSVAFRMHQARSLMFIWTPSAAHPVQKAKTS